MISIADKIQNVRQLIKNAAISAGRDASNIQLLAVSKTRPVEDILVAFNSGQKCFAENYLQEALGKISALGRLNDLEWHFIGPIQSNKTRAIAEHFQWAQTLDREKVAQRLHQQRPEALPPLNICIQINIDDEATKSGIMPAELMPLAEKIDSLDRLCLRGLMAIPKADQTETDLQQSFEKMKTLFEQLQAHYPTVDTLSLGMSADMTAAITAGSTMVRVGTAIFGERDYRTGQIG